MAVSSAGKLSRRERMALSVARAVNERSLPKALSQRWNEAVTSRWMRLVSSARMNLVGVNKLAALRPDRGVLLAVNHRSFFDQFMVTIYLQQHTELCRRIYFPVRSTFFYEGPAGLLVNAATSAMAMYPPVFRETDKRQVTRSGLDFLATELARPGTLVGIHPEGTRGKGDDPYELLPPEPGFGRVALSAMPVVIPVFINGLGNDFLAEVRATFRRNAEPIVIVFGEPVNLSEFADQDSGRVRNQVAVARKVLGAIGELAQHERSIREALRSGHSLPGAISVAGGDPADSISYGSNRRQSR